MRRQGNCAGDAAMQPACQCRRSGNALAYLGPQFDFNRAPFVQSFMEALDEGCALEIELRPQLRKGIA